MRYRVALVFSLASLAATLPLGAPQVRIGTVLDGPWARNDEIRALFQRELQDLLSLDFTVRFPPDAQLEADWTLAGVQAAVSQLLADTTIDLVITPGVIASTD